MQNDWELVQVEYRTVGRLMFFGIVTIMLLVLTYLSFSGKLSHSKMLRGILDTGYANDNDRKHPNYKKACVYMGIVYLICSAASLLFGLYCLSGDERLKIGLAVIACCAFALLIISVPLFRNKK